MTVGDRIKKRREELNLSQDEVAKKMGYKSRNAIYQYEQCDNMKITMVQRFANALECEPSYLMGWDDEIEEQNVGDDLAEIYMNKRLLLYTSKLLNLTPAQQEIVYNMIDALSEKGGE